MATMILFRFECIADGAPYSSVHRRLGIEGPPRYYVRPVEIRDGKIVVGSNMHHMKDFSDANGVGTRGVYAEYILAEGDFYRVKQPLSWTRFDEYYCTVRNGEIVRLSREEVERCLSDTWT